MDASGDATTVGLDTIHYGALRLAIPAHDGPGMTSLLASHVFNPAFALAEAIETELLTCEGGSVVEFGAAAGLPSLLLSTQIKPPRTVVLTDHPTVVHVTRLNATACASLAKTHVAVVAHRWGDDVSEVLSANGGEKFDLALLSDLLWLKDSAVELVQSLCSLLKETGTAWIGAGDYTTSEVCDRFEGLLGEQGLSWHRIVLDGGWKGTTEVRGVVWNDEGHEPSASEVRSGLADRKAKAMLYRASWGNSQALMS